MPTSSRPAVKRQYGARKPPAASTSTNASATPSTSRRIPSSTSSSSPTRTRPHEPTARSSDWSDAVKDSFSSPAPPPRRRARMTSGASSERERPSTPPTTEGEEDELEVAPSSSARTLRERKTPVKAPPPAQAPAAKGDLRSFFQRTSPRKRARVSPSVVDDDERSEAMARTASSASSASSGSASSTSTRTSRSSLASSCSASTSSSSAATNKRPKLEQLYLDPFRTSGHLTLSCATCALSYARTPEDQAFHARHHKKVVAGCDWVASDEGARGVSVLEDAADWGERTGGRVLMVDYAAATDSSLKRKLKDVFETIDTELSSTALTPEQLALSKVFLFVTPQRKVIAAAVVQRISDAFEVVVQEQSADEEGEVKPSAGLLRFGDDDGAIFCSSTPSPTLLGIQRIWTSTSSRRHGLASLLLDFAAAKFVYGSPIAHERRAVDFAFSQPTGKGQKLARAWTGTRAFKVFVD
ncbi:hypothetical protein JCM8208_001137 [Rhodotorula glutinis]